MGTLRATAYVDVHGPLFDGTAEKVIDEIKDEIAKRGAQYARDRLAEIPMDKTGRAHGGFQENLKVVKRDLGYAVPGPMVTGVAWAPWLEGVSKRNATTRFKGYRPFRTVAKELQDGKAQEIAEKVVKDYLPEMGGES